MILGEEIQTRLKQNLDAEISFYASRGLINKEEQILLASTFTQAVMVASKTLPLELNQRPIIFSQEITETNLTNKIEQVVDNVMVKLGIKATYDDSPWNGSASQWKTPEAYCSSCLIDMNSGSGPKVKDKCHLPYKKPGSSAINKNALRAMASGGRGLPALKGVPHDQIVKAANFMISHWQSAFDKPAPASIYRMAGKTPPENSKETSVKFFKDNQGQWWMLGIYSNRWMDREHEILSEAAHKEYADWVNKTGFKPQVTVYHLPKMPSGFWKKVWDKWGSEVDKLNGIVKKVYSKISLGEVERVVYLNGFSVSVAKIYPERYEAAEKLAMMGDVGMSHGFLAFEESDPADFSSTEDTVNIIEKYRSFEVSVLLRKRAANYGTAPLFVEGKKVAYSEEDKKFMSAILPTDLMEALDSDTKEASEVLDELLNYKELLDMEEKTDEAPVTPQESQQEEKAAQAAPSKPADEEDTEDEECKEGDCMEDKKPSTKSGEEIVADVVKALNLEELQKVLGTLVENQNKLFAEIETLKTDKVVVEREVKELKKSEDEKIAEKISPFNWGSVGFSPSKTDGNVLSKEQAEQKAKEGPGAAQTITGDPVIDNMFKSIKLGN